MCRMLHMTITEYPVWTVGDRLTKAREWAGMTQADIAAALKIGRRSIVRYESSETPPRPVVIAYSAVTGAPLWWIEGTTPPEGVDVSTIWPIRGPSALPPGRWSRLAIAA